MKIRDLIARLLPQDSASRDKDLLPRGFGESRPHGHFREFTVPRRLQRGGLSLPAAGPAKRRCPDGIIPCTGENIP
jgi:hypothetical protein